MNYKFNSIITLFILALCLFLFSCDRLNLSSHKALKAHPGNGIYSMDISPDGTKLASGSSDQTIKIWSLPDLNLISTLEGHTDWVYSLDYSPDGTKLVSGGMDGYFIVWDVSSGDILTKKSLKDWCVNPPMEVAFSPSGDKIICGSRVNYGSSGFSIHSSKTGEFIEYKTKFKPEDIDNCRSYSDRMPCYSIAVDSNRPIIAAGCAYRYKPPPILVFDMVGDGTIHLYYGHTDTVTSLAFHPDGKTFASGSMDKTVRIWDVETQNCLKILEGYDSWISSVVYSPDGNLIASSSWKDSRIILWSPVTGKMLDSLEASDVVSKIKFSSDGRTLYASCLDGNLHRFKI